MQTKLRKQIEINNVPKTLWMAISTDKYQLPIYIADTAAELADYLGVKKGTVYSEACDRRKMLSTGISGHHATNGNMRGYIVESVNVV